MVAAKKCSTCAELRPLSAFSIRRASVDGLAYICKTCDTSRRKESYLRRHEAELDSRRRWRGENYEKSLEIVRAWDLKNAKEKSEGDKRWRAANRERLSELKKEYRRKHKGRYNSYFRAYELLKKCRMPPWADVKAIHAIYERASELRKAGHDVEVDHIVPLHGKKVSGLHVAHNLQILTAQANRAKSNNFAGEA